MNEVTKINLGRQVFTIAADAHHRLKTYVAAIKKEVDDPDVVEEIEIRMAELLTEQGITSEKVVLEKDVEYLQKQLGDPKDFTDDGKAEAVSADSKNSDGTKRLFRDTDDAMVAGVAAGLAKYFGLDVLLVRILFLLLLFITFGGGVLVYILLWILVPEAKTASDKLQMAGKSVTVDSLKEMVERADIKGAAHRANNTFAGPINTFFRFIIKTVGVAIIVIGLGMLFGLMALLAYVLLHSGNLLQDNFFPVGLREHTLLYLSLADAGLIALFIILFGLSIFRRKWPIHAWLTGTLVGLLLIGLAGGGALGATVAPQIRDRYNANLHTTVRQLSPFTSLNVIGDNADVNFQTASTYYVSLHYFDHPNLSTIKTSVKNNTLTIDSSPFNWHRNCNGLCIPDVYNVSITVYAPNAQQLANQFDYAPPPVPQPAPAYQP